MDRRDRYRHARAFGRNARKLRIAAGLSRKDVDLVVGIHPSNLDKVEKGQRLSWLPMIPRLAKAYRVHQRELLNFYFDYNPDRITSRKGRLPKKKT